MTTRVAISDRPDVAPSTVEERVARVAYVRDTAAPGPPGADGTDGREVELQASGTAVQWRYVGDADWVDVVPLSVITGPAGGIGPVGLSGLDGSPGREVELTRSATHIQWRYMGDAAWMDLVPLVDITGPKGDPGAQGLSGADGAPGAPGSDGAPGTDGADGREVEFQQSATHVQWRYVGDATWLDLVPLSVITGPAGADGADGAPGTPGADGADGREIELQKSATAVQWRYVGDADWTDLVPLTEITGPAGTGGGGSGVLESLKGPWGPHGTYVSGDVVLHASQTWVADGDPGIAEPGVATTTEVVLDYSGASINVDAMYSPAQRVRFSRDVKIRSVTVRGGPSAGAVVRVGFATAKSLVSSIAVSADVQLTAATDSVIPLVVDLQAHVDYFFYIEYVSGPSGGYAVATGAPLSYGGAAHEVPSTGEQWYYDIGVASSPNSSFNGWFKLTADLAPGTGTWRPLTDRALAPRTTATVITAALAAGAQEVGTVQLAAGYRVYELATDRPARVRLYATDAQRDADAARALGTDPTGDHGLMLEYVTTAGALSGTLSPVVDGFDGKVTPDGLIPHTIDNLDTAAGAVSCTFTYLRTE